MTDLTVPLPPVPERPKPDLAKEHVDTVVEILNSTTVSRFAAEEELAHRGLDGVFAIFVARLVDNLFAWTASGDWPDRRRTAGELVAELVESGEFDLNNPADARLLRLALDTAENG